MKLDQERQVGPSDVYDDTLPAGSTLESSSTDLRYDLNALRSQVRRLIELKEGETPNVKLRFRRVGASDTAYIRRARVWLIKIVDGEET
jgi:hypothetical protein